MIASGDCCVWNSTSRSADDDGDDIIISPSATTTSTATLAAAAAAISTTSTPPRRIRRRRQRQRSLAHANDNNSMGKNQNSATSMMSSRRLTRTDSDRADGSGSAAAKSNYCHGGSDSTLLSIASTSGSSSSSSSSSSNLDGGCNCNGSSSADNNSNRASCSSLPLSPAFSIFSSNSSLVGDNNNMISSHNNRLKNNDQTPSNDDDDPTQQSLQYEQQQQQQHCQPLATTTPSHHLLPSDFTPQTWLSAVHETVSSTTVRYYCSAGAAAALTAVIVIHPLALMGAVATAAAGAGATAMTMWAVGFFHDLDRGYQIWSSEEFGKLFWKDSDEKKEEEGKENENEEDEQANSQLFIQEGVVEVQRLVAVAAQPPDRRVTSSMGEMDRRSLLDEEQRVDEEEEDTLDLVKGDADIEKVTTESSSSPERLTSSLSRSKKQLPSPSRRGYGIRKIRSNPTVPSIKPMVRRFKMQNGILTRQRTPMTAVGLEDDESHPSSSSSTATTSTPSKRSPSKNNTGTTTLSTTSPPPSPLVNHRNIIDRFFPPLEICVVHSVKLPGLDSASQFFSVFFADDAPYSMRDFQKRRGDVDIIYEPWEDCQFSTLNDDGGGGDDNDELLFSLKEGDGSSVIEPLPRSSTRQRRLKFNTLTKSYFGPAYAKATKIQRATQLQNDRILIIENVTQLAEIPFSDRFRVLERWILEVTEEGEGGSETSSAAATASAEFEIARTKITSCTLAVYAEVQMLKSCSWEPQIRKKASETFTDVATDWCKSAVVALAATEEQKRKRQRLERESSRSKGDVENSKTSSERRRPPRIPSPMTVVDDAPASTADIPPSMVRERSQLFAEHKRNFDELDKLTAQGDLEWCSVEVSQSSHFEYCVSNAKKNNEEVRSKSLSAFATVLENSEVDEYEITSSIAGSSIEDGDDAKIKDGSHRKSAFLMRSKSRKLLRRLSSRGGGT